MWQVNELNDMSDIESFSDNELPLSSILTTNNLKVKHQKIDVDDIKSDIDCYSDNELPLSSIANALLPINHTFIKREVQKSETIDYQSTLNYKSEISLIHSKEQHIDNLSSKYECDICGLIFFKRMLIIKHFRNSLCFPDNLVYFKNNSSRYNLCKHSRNAKLYFNVTNNVITNNKEQMDKCKMCHTVIQSNKCNKLYTKENNLKCKSCPLFYNFTQTNTHYNKNELRWKCKVCGELFTKLSILKAHRFVHLENKPFNCDKYNKSNINFNSLEKYNTLSNVYTHTCQYNNSNSNVSQHNCKMHNLSQNYECSRCSKVFHKRSEIVNHIFKMHEEYYSKYSCDSCSNLYKSTQELVLHLEKKLFKCGVCSQSFTTAYRLHQHYRWHLGIDNFKCQYCSIIFSKYSVYLFHEKNHIGEKPFRCNFCGKWFPVLSNLNIHLSFGNSFVCNICQKIFSEMSSLLSHKRIHTKDKQLKNKCKKEVKHQSTTLKVHTRQLTNKKIYKCNACFKQFTRLSLLNSHIKTHFIKDFRKCESSNNLFSKSSSLNKHKNVQVNDEFFKCKLCQEIISNRKMFITHKCISYECKLCQRKFNTSSILKTHYENIHKNNNIYESTTNINEHKKGHIQPENSISLALNVNNEFNEMENMLLNKNYKCDLCMLEIYNPSQIITHILQTHY